MRVYLKTDVCSLSAYVYGVHMVHRSTYGLHSTKFLCFTKFVLNFTLGITQRIQTDVQHDISNKQEGVFVSKSL